MVRFGALCVVICLLMLAVQVLGLPVWVFVVAVGPVIYGFETVIERV